MAEYMAAVGGVVNTFGAILEGQTAQAQGDYSATVLEQQAAQARNIGTAQQEQHRRQVRQLQGAQAASIAQSGAGFGGSAADIMQQSATEAELDNLMIRYQADTQAQGLNADAAYAKYEGKAAKRASYLKAGGSLLGGASDYAQLSGQRKARNAAREDW